MPKSANTKVSVWVVVTACLPAVAFISWWFHMWLGPWQGIGREGPTHEWRKAVATVTAVSAVKGRDAFHAYRVTQLSYQDYYGRARSKSVLMPYTEHVGQKEEMSVGRKGDTWVRNDLRELYEKPTDSSGTFGIWGVMLGLFPVWLLPAIIIAFLTTKILTPIDRGLRWLARTPLGELSSRQLKRPLLHAFDELKLRWEFFRRRKRVRPSVTYKTVRRFQAELARMDPTPSVIIARRRANELLTKVLERDNRQVEVIDGTLGEIRKDINLDLEARRLAREELAQ